MQRFEPKFSGMIDRVGVLVVVCALLYGCAGSGKLISEAESALRVGSVDIAKAALEKARNRSRNVEETVGINLKLAQIHIDEISESVGEGESTDLAEQAAEELYREVLSLAGDEDLGQEQKNRWYTEAANNLGLILNASSRTEEAVNVYEKYRSKVTDDDLGKYLENYGKSLEDDGRRFDAIDAYIEAIRADPERQRAIEYGTDLLLVGDGFPKSYYLTFVKELLASGNGDDATEIVRNLMADDSWINTPYYEDLVGLLIEVLIEESPSFNEFARDWKPFLASLEGRVGEPSSHWLAGVERSFSSEDLSWDLDQQRAAEILFDSEPPERYRGSVSRLLVVAGGKCLGVDNLKCAASRFALSVAFNASNGTAVADLLNVVSLAPGVVDPSGEVISDVEKSIKIGGASREGFSPGKLSGIYLLLGDAYAKRSEREGSRELRRKALGHWRTALTSIAERDSDLPKVEVYKAVSQRMSSGYRALGDEITASYYIKRFNQLNREVGPEESVPLPIEWAQQEVAGGDWRWDNSSESFVYGGRDRPVEEPIEIGPDAIVSLGHRGAQVKVMTFLDFESLESAEAVTVIRAIRAAYRGAVRIEVRHFPDRTIHPNAQKASEASLCANEQGRFWQMHDLLLHEQQSLRPGDLVEKAERLKLDVSKFRECLDEDRYLEAVTRDLELGARLGIVSAPAVVVDGHLVKGKVTIPNVFKLIDDQLANRR